MCVGCVGRCVGVRGCNLGGREGAWVCWAYVGRAWGVCVGQEKWVSLAPLYYPDTLVNPDTCLGTYRVSQQVLDRNLPKKSLIKVTNSEKLVKVCLLTF